MNERVHGGKRRERRTPTGDVLEGKRRRPWQEGAREGRCKGGKEATREGENVSEREGRCKGGEKRVREGRKVPGREGRCKGGENVSEREGRYQGEKEGARDGKTCQ